MYLSESFYFYKCYRGYSSKAYNKVDRYRSPVSGNNTTMFFLHFLDEEIFAELHIQQHQKIYQLINLLLVAADVRQEWLHRLYWENLINILFFKILGMKLAPKPCNLCAPAFFSLLILVKNMVQRQ